MDLQSLPLGDFFIRLAIDLAAAFVLVRLIYYRTYRHADLFLTLFSFNIAIFLIAFVLNGSTMSIGAAFGLFAVFSMLRYRTEGISTTDMTYLFLVIALGLMMAISTIGLAGLVGIAVLLVGTTFILENGLLGRKEHRQDILYDNMALLKAASREPLLADLRERTGLNVLRIEILEIDLVRDAARLAVFYRDDK